MQYVWYPYLRNLYYLGWDPHLYRVFSTLLDPNFAGIIFAFTLFLGAYLWQKTKRQSLVLLSQLLTLVALFLTYSRSSYVAFFLGGFIFVLRLKMAKLGLVLAAVFIAILLLLPRPGGEGVKLFRTVSTFARLGNWQRGMELIREAPLLGHGFNTLRYVQRAKGWVDDSTIVSKAGAGIDSSIQFVWATTGVVGLAMYGWLFFRMLQMARTSTAYLATLGAVLVHSAFSNSLFYPWVLLWLWILTGSIERIEKQDPSLRSG